MIADPAQADNEMSALFRQAWTMTAGHPVVWPNAAPIDINTLDVWAHWSLQYTGGRQLTFGPAGRRKFEKTGAVLIVVFTPLANGLRHGRQISQIALGAYEGKRTAGGVAFANVRIESEGQGQGDGVDRAWWATAVVAEFRYEHLR